MGNIEKTLSVLFGKIAAKKNIFRCAKLNGVGYFGSAEPTRAALRLSFRCWTSQKSNIRVASETLESMTTFTRHHAFLKKAGENFREFGASVW